jgi:hypothetical protein
MTAHTPEPWRVLADEQIMGRPISGRWAVEADGAYICLDPEWDDECHAESLANARLIAAAPDLLEALQSMVYEFGKRRHDSDELIVGDTQNPFVRQAQEVIAKARGET